jgi:hypothetical protein
VARPEGFEPLTLCLECMPASSHKCPHFRHLVEISRLSSSRRACLGVRKCRRLHIGSLQESLHSAAIETKPGRGQTIPMEEGTEREPRGVTEEQDPFRRIQKQA